MYSVTFPPGSRRIRPVSTQSGWTPELRGKRGKWTLHSPAHWSETPGRVARGAETTCARHHSITAVVDVVEVMKRRRRWWVVCFLRPLLCPIRAALSQQQQQQQLLPLLLHLLLLLTWSRAAPHSCFTENGCQHCRHGDWKRREIWWKHVFCCENT